ncbi:MAG: hypothetical protein IPO15_01105 [Anaerolineae bacterium]|uniref:hypothetical protein n=1 Tax=Candidatus Amarolinea dominans TaxID=3140696 RepID=UPI0031360A31|nr:hypothetical protein [Anaerolineae bacterium]
MAACNRLVDQSDFPSFVGVELIFETVNRLLHTLREGPQQCVEGLAVAYRIFGKVKNNGKTAFLLGVGLIVPKFVRQVSYDPGLAQPADSPQHDDLAQRLPVLGFLQLVPKTLQKFLACNEFIGLVGRGWNIDDT